MVDKEKQKKAPRAQDLESKDSEEVQRTTEKISKRTTDIIKIQSELKPVRPANDIDALNKWRLDLIEDLLNDEKFTKVFAPGTRFVEVQQAHLDSYKVEAYIDHNLISDFTFFINVRTGKISDITDNRNPLRKLNQEIDPDKLLKSIRKVDYRLKKS